MHLLEPAWDSLKREFDAACSQSAQTGRGQTTRDLNQFLRRLAQYRTEAEWVSCVLDEAGRFAERLAVFSLDQQMLRLRGQQNLALPDDLSFPLHAAAAFVSVVETKDPVVSLRSPGEVGQQLSTPNASDRAHLFPVMNRSRVTAVIFADAGSVDIDGLELIAGIGSLVLRRQSNAGLHAQIAPAAPITGTHEQALESLWDGLQPARDFSPADGSTKRSSASLLPWAALNEQHRTLHLRARRFSRVTIAEMQLSRPGACRAGREQRNLYLFLKSELDKARDVYRKQFMTIPSMVDYLHVELVRTAAEGDELKLGAEYPGSLV
ncbi:MAG TPA: hypothetical protein VH601_05625 [Bryobacteraceae bacterium]|jgi:hypothetical protein